jgi:hypothetical protein
MAKGKPMAKDKLKSRDDLIEVYTDGEPIRFVHEVAPVPLREIAKGKRYVVFRRSGVIKRLLERGRLLEVKPPPPPPTATAKVVKAKSEPSATKSETKPEK